MRTSPWLHQLAALDFLATRSYAALYTDMGTGKTKVGIDLIVNRRYTMSLIVGTKKACQVWEDEFKIHAYKLPKLLRLDKFSTKEKVIKLKELNAVWSENQAPTVLIINYESIWRKPFSEYLLKMPIECVICDESHRIKSPGSKCSLYLTRLGRYVKNRYLLTGTPSTESPVDVYAQYRFLQPNIFGTRLTVFRARYENLDEQRTAYAGYRVLDKKQPYKNLDELKEKMYSCAFYVENPLDLPDTADLTVQFTPSAPAQTVYKKIEKDGAFIDENGIFEVNNALTKALRLQEILSGYVVQEDESFTEHTRIELDHKRALALFEILEGIAKTEKVVIFAKFRHDFEEIQSVCKDLNRKYGEISGQQDDYEKWKTDQINTLAVQYQSGSESINLTKARYCIYYSGSHSYGLYAQSRKRVHRPGQSRPVIYYHIQAVIPKTITIDQKIAKALEQKKDLVDFLLSI